MYTHYYHYLVVGDRWVMFAHRKEVVLSSSLNAVFSALNDTFESEEGECYVACAAGGVYRPSESGEASRGSAHVISPPPQSPLGFVAHKRGFAGPLLCSEKAASNAG